MSSAEDLYPSIFLDWYMLSNEQKDAMCAVKTTAARDDFLAHLEAAKAERLRKEGACPECEQITPRDPHKTNCSKGNT